MFISRKYLSEKYRSLKWDMEKVLCVEDETQEDRIDVEDVKRVFWNIKDKCISIVTELEKCKNE